MAKMREELSKFADRCEEILKQNDYKLGWQDCSQSTLVDKLKEEVDELFHVLDKMKNRKDITDEACDVANIAMMIADNWGE